MAVPGEGFVEIDTKKRDKERRRAEMREKEFARIHAHMSGEDSLPGSPDPAMFEGG